jgi:filamentous hemagglutinin
MQQNPSARTPRTYSRQPLRLGICMLLSWALVLQPLTGVAAGIVVDTGAPVSQQAQVTAANNGVPLVQIAAPNASGLSHNQYTDYNVSTQGLILNNAQSATTTQLGGAVLANPNLQQAGATASVILNEVTSTNHSRLEGFQEVAGDRADLILANPNGITCRGCGFINTPRATLSTGRSLVDNGALQGFEVREGDILIEGAGANAEGADAFDLVSRRVQLDGAVNGRDVHIVTGANRVDYATRTATAIAGTGDAPAYLVDSSALGGVYANRIFLLGNEQGVGVRLRGDMATSVGEISLRNDGRIELNGNGLTASGNLTVDSGGLELTTTNATLYGEQDLALNSGPLSMSGTTAVADGRAVVTTSRNLTLSDSTLGGRTSLYLAVNDHLQLENSLVASDQTLAIEATTVNIDAASSSGKGVVSGGDLSLVAAQSHSRIDSNTLNSGAGLRQTGLLSGSSDIESVQHQNASLQGGEVKTRSAGDTTLAGGSIEGRTVNTEVGGDLTIVSKVDWVDFEVREQGAIAGTAVGEGGGGRLDGFGQVIHAIEHAPEHVKTADQVEKGRVEGLSSPSGIHSQQGTTVNVKGGTRLEGGQILQQDGPARLDSNGLQREAVQVIESDGTHYKRRTIRSQVGKGNLATDPPQGEKSSGVFEQEVVPALEAEDDVAREKIERQRQ